jgi:hypothetical protein
VGALCKVQLAAKRGRLKRYLDALKHTYQKNPTVLKSRKKVSASDPFQVPGGFLLKLVFLNFDETSLLAGCASEYECTLTLFQSHSDPGNQAIP